MRQSYVSHAVTVIPYPFVKNHFFIRVRVFKQYKFIKFGQTVCFISEVSFTSEAVCSNQVLQQKQHYEYAAASRTAVVKVMRSPYACRSLSVSENSTSAVRWSQLMSERQYEAVGILRPTQASPNITFCGCFMATVANMSELIDLFTRDSAVFGNCSAFTPPW